jgi:hypothetical protein
VVSVDWIFCDFEDLRDPFEKPFSVVIFTMTSAASKVSFFLKNFSLDSIIVSTYNDLY